MPSSGHTVDRVQLIQQRIRERAYFLYVARGRQDGHALDDWLQAEAEMISSDKDWTEQSAEVVAPGRNISELLFEKCVQQHGVIELACEPMIDRKQRRPDYRLRHAGEELFFEVKEFRQDPHQPLPQGAYDPYTAIREKINSDRDKFREFKENSCSLVLYNVDAWLVHLDDAHIVMGAMLGDLGMQFAVNNETGTAVGEPTWAFLKRGKMIDYKRLRPQNTTVSAIVAIDELPIGQRRVHLELDRKERELGRKLELDEFLRFAETLKARAIDAAERVLRVIVYENPYARIPLRRDLFVGAWDERFGAVDGGIGRLFVGNELRRVEEAEQHESKRREQPINRDSL